MEHFTIVSIFLNYKTFFDYPSHLDHIFRVSEEKYFSLISQIIWFSFWINTRKIFPAIISGILILILTLFLSCYYYVATYREYHYIFYFIFFFTIVSVISSLMIYFWMDNFLFGSSVCNILLLIYYSYSLCLFMISDSKDDFYERSYSLCIINIIISFFCLCYAIYIKFITFILTSSLEIIIFTLFILAEYFYQKKLEEKKKKIQFRKKIQEGKFKKIICKPSEEEFIFDDATIIYKNPRKIYDCDWNLFVDIKKDELIDKIDNNIFIFSSDTKNDYFLRQTNLGNCFLVSSIISLINIPGILDYLFYFEDLSKDNYTDKDKEISVFCYIRGIKTIIKINNSFPSFKFETDSLIYKNKYLLESNLSLIPFTTSKNGVLLGQVLIKAFICLMYLNKDILNKIEEDKSDKNIYLTYNEEKENKDKNILNDKNYLLSNIIKIVHRGLTPEYPMNLFLGCISEIIYVSYIRNNENKKNVINKIIKYINIGGFIEIAKHYKKGDGHGYTLQGYIELKEKRNVYYFSIINPHKKFDSLESDEFSEEDIKELESPLCENEDNKNTISKISYINKNYIKTGHMVIKDEILLKWFNVLTFSESMFGANELLFFIKENDPIYIEVKKESNICIDICSIKTEIEIDEINKYIKFEFKDISDENNIKKVEFIDKIYINKIYEKLSEGKYQLSFIILKDNNKDTFRCRIRYYKEDIIIKEKESMEVKKQFF